MGIFYGIQALGIFSCRRVAPSPRRSTSSPRRPAPTPAPHKVCSQCGSTHPLGHEQARGQEPCDHCCGLPSRTSVLAVCPEPSLAVSFSLISTPFCTGLAGSAQICHQLSSADFSSAEVC